LSSPSAGVIPVYPLSYPLGRLGIVHVANAAEPPDYICVDLFGRISQSLSDLPETGGHRLWAPYPSSSARANSRKNGAFLDPFCIVKGLKKYIQTDH